MDRTAALYSRPFYGGGMPVFSGSRRQKGGSIFGALQRFFMPVVKAFGRKIVKHGAQQAVGLAKDVVKDAFLTGNVKDSVRKHGKKRALDLTRYVADEGLSTLQNMIGSGRRRRRRRQQSLRKRKRSSKRSKSKPAKKRRRTVKSLF